MPQGIQQAPMKYIGLGDHALGVTKTGFDS